MDARKRAEIYHRINRIWVEDAAAMPLYVGPPDRPISVN